MIALQLLLLRGISNSSYLSHVYLYKLQTYCYTVFYKAQTLHYKLERIVFAEYTKGARIL